MRFGRGEHPRALRGPRAGERGAALVEAAIVMPLILLLTFGIIELARMYNARSTVSQATRAAGRIASAQPLSGSLTETAADAAGSVLSRMERDAPREIWVYRVLPDETGEPPATCSGQCVSYQWDPAAQSFDTAQPGGGAWDTSDPSQLDVCSDPFDQVGIYVHTEVPWITSLLSTDLVRSIDDWSVFRFEPVPTAQCA